MLTCKRAMKMKITKVLLNTDQIYIHKFYIIRNLLVHALCLEVDVELGI